MPIDFPNTPTADQIFTAADGRQWTWTGSVWNIVTNNSQVETLAAALEVLEDSVLTLDVSIDIIDNRIEDNQVLSVMGAI